MRLRTSVLQAAVLLSVATSSLACTASGKSEKDSALSKAAAPLSEVEVSSREQTLRAMYIDVLSRDPKPEEVALAKDAWAKGRTLVDSARSILTTEEQRSILIASYQKRFLRKRNPIIGRDLLSNKELEAGHPHPLLVTLLAGDEFHAFFGSDNSTTVKALYKALLSRAPTQAEFDVALASVAATEGRREMVSALLATEEYLAEQLLRGWYQKYLHRAPMPAVRAELLTLLKAGESHWDIQARILGSAEYVSFHSCSKVTCRAGGKNCGVLSDGCGGTLDCGECDIGLECGAESPNVCGVKCERMTCLERLAECGSIDDGCGGTLDCGTCPSGRTCGADGIANTCAGTGACKPRTCRDLGKTYGRHFDGCGAMVDCGPEPASLLDESP